mmetsp:Transcript_100080/g.311826  ORF Transcript_100080/g.311826 Transcript_100080/m.311826 type:complete len:259 (+) Transcript_100080:250-1026(+)
MTAASTFSTTRRLTPTATPSALWAMPFALAWSGALGTARTWCSRRRSCLGATRGPGSPWPRTASASPESTSSRACRPPCSAWGSTTLTWPSATGPTTSRQWRRWSAASTAPSTEAFASTGPPPSGAPSCSRRPRRWPTGLASCPPAPISPSTTSSCGAAWRRSTPPSTRLPPGAAWAWASRSGPPWPPASSRGSTAGAPRPRARGSPRIPSRGGRTSSTSSGRSSGQSACGPWRRGSAAAWGSWRWPGAWPTRTFPRR